jgi:hypothetical protein
LSLGATDEIDLTATAIDINGTLDVSGTTAFGGAVTITETGSGSASGPFLNLLRDSSSPADGDDIGIIQFQGDDDAGNVTTYASVSASIHDASNTTEDGRFNLNTTVAGSSVSRMYMVPTATAFNDGSGDIDFRVESNGNTHMLFVDAGNDTVVIGSGSVTAPATVDFLSYASSAAGRSAFVHGSGDGGVVVSGVGAGSAASLIFGNDWGSDGSGFTEEYRLIMDGSDDSLQIKYNGNSNEAARFDSSGNFFISTTNANPHTLSSGGGTKFFNSSGTFLAVARDSQTVIGANRTGSSAGAVLDLRLDGTVKGEIGVESTGITFNESSADLDFRVESDGNANMLFVDAGNDRVSIKTGSAINSATLSVAGSIAFDGQSVGTYNDASGWIDFTSTSDTNLMRIHSGGDTGESSQIEISTVVSGSQSDAISVESGGTTVINQDSVNIRDFRVESDGNANMLFVDSSTNRVGIGQSSPATTVDIGGAVNSDMLTMTSVAGRGLKLGTAVRGSQNDGVGIIDAQDTEGSGGRIEFHTAGVQRAYIESTQVIFNDNAADQDFRIEGDNVANLFIVDAGTDEVRIPANIAAQTMASLNVRDNGAGIEFGHQNNSAGYFGTIGAFGNNGHPYIGFSCASESSANTFSTFGHAGSLIKGDLSGNMIFAQVSTASATGQTPVERVKVSPSEFIVNDASNDYDFRVEGDGDSHALFVDASSDTVLIGKNTTALTTTGSTLSSAGTATFSFSLTSINESFILNNNNATGATFKMDFRQNNSSVGNISAGSSSTAYNTSSDYRLKENVETLKDGLSRLAQLKPVQFTWTKDGALSEGFIAHEVDEVFPDAVTGEKDAVDEEGNIAAQQIDYGRITPLLVKAIQEQQEQIEELKAEIATLKGG